MARIYNFSAGPSTLPLEVLEEAAGKFVDYENSGMSLIEMSHRGKQYDAVHSETIALVREILQVPDTSHVLLLQGGATLQFGMVPMNLLTGSSTGAYVDTGAWASKAFNDAGHHGDVYEAWSGRAIGYSRTPEAAALSIRDDTRYVFDPNIDSLTYRLAQETAVKAFQALGCRDYGRVDFIVDREAGLQLLEINTIPGFTDHSLLPKAAAEVGIGFDELVARLLALAGERKAIS